ncbi:unnamed protein product, partial [marine sediment metagenome]
MPKLIDGIKNLLGVGSRESSTGTETTGKQADQAGSAGDILGWVHPLRADDATYDRMLNDPTIRLAFAVGTMAMRTAEWTYMVRDGVPDDAKELVEADLEPKRPRFIQDAIDSHRYGWKPFEIVFDLLTDNGPPRIALTKIKPLRNKPTKIVVDKRGNVIGVDADGGKTELRDYRAMVLTYDMHDDDPRGNSRLEPARGVFNEYNTLATRQAQYNRKAGIILPQIW